jgi:SAM-dependent methyltransferase
MQIWEKRYSAKEFAYGKEPNEFFARSIVGKNPGRLLVPAAGEGRDAVHAAKLGWQVTAFDTIEAGMNKCNLLAEESGVRIDYRLCDALDFEPEPEGYDMIVLTYFHLPSTLRKTIYPRFADWLKPGGMILLEAFSKKQLGNASGGPKDPDWLFSLEDLKTDLDVLQFQTAEETQTVLSEGIYHQGAAEVVRLKANKPG